MLVNQSFLGDEYLAYFSLGFFNQYSNVGASAEDGTWKQVERHSKGEQPETEGLFQDYNGNQQAQQGQPLFEDYNGSQHKQQG
ncbi:hypothetical protein PI125_g16215 [Phytophthora idaei]|nr:hypothetical protein PI125_g16215 [Phytophthora idaei]